MTTRTHVKYETVHAITNLWIVLVFRALLERHMTTRTHVKYVTVHAITPYV
jgi:hypothetical protein